MISFIDKTWFLWWIFAGLAILRWFYLFLSPTDDTAIDVSDLSEEEASTALSEFHQELQVVDSPEDRHAF